MREPPTSGNTFDFTTWRTALLEVADAIEQNPSQWWLASPYLPRLRDLLLQVPDWHDRGIFDTCIEAIRSDHGEYLAIIEAIIGPAESGAWSVEALPTLIARAPEHASLVLSDLLVIAFRVADEHPLFEFKKALRKAAPSHQDAILDFIAQVEAAGEFDPEDCGWFNIDGEWNEANERDRIIRERERRKSIESEKHQAKMRAIGAADAQITELRCPDCKQPCPAYRLTCKHCGATVGRGDDRRS